MATTAVTAESLEVGAESADLRDSGGGSGNGIVAATPADGWVISPESGRNLADGLLVLTLHGGAAGDTITITAGDKPPSHRQGLGADTVVLAAADTKYYVPDLGRHIQNDGTIIVTATAADAALTAIQLPRGH